MAARRRRASTAKTVQASSKGGMCHGCCMGMGKSWMVICGLVLLVLGVLLWKGMWGLEWVVAILLVLVGLLKIFVGLKG